MDVCLEELGEILMLRLPFEIWEMIKKYVLKERMERIIMFPMSQRDALFFTAHHIWTYRTIFFDGSMQLKHTVRINGKAHVKVINWKNPWKVSVEISADRKNFRRIFVFAE